MIKLGDGGAYAYAIDLDYCKGCGICVAECPCGRDRARPGDDLDDERRRVREHDCRRAHARRGDHLPARATLRKVAAILAAHRIHAVVVATEHERTPLAVVTDRDVIWGHAHGKLDR